MQPVFGVRTMEERVAETWATHRLLSFLLAIFAGLALFLAAVGLYGVLAYSAFRRLREMRCASPLVRDQKIFADDLRRWLPLFGSNSPWVRSVGRSRACDSTSSSVLRRRSRNLRAVG